MEPSEDHKCPNVDSRLHLYQIFHRVWTTLIVHPILDIVMPLHVVSFNANDYHYMKYWYKRNKFYGKSHIFVTIVSNFALCWITITKIIIPCIPLCLWHCFKTKILLVLRIYYVNPSIIRKILFVKYVWRMFLW